MVNYKKFITLLLIFSVYMMPFNTHAAGFGGWTITNTVAQGASTILTGSKEVILNGAKKIATGTATITPTASQVAKVLARGAAGYALSVAVEQLLGAVSWVLDPENNRIIYYENNPTNLPMLWVWDARIEGKDGVSSPDEACQKLNLTKADAERIGNYMYKINGRVKSFTDNGNTAICEFDAYNTYSDEYYGKTTSNVTKKVNNAYDPDASSEDDEKYLPLPTVAEQVISNAEGNDVTAQEATTAAAADIINEAENDNVKARPIVQQLENSQTIPTDETATGESTPTDTTGQTTPTDLSLDFPVFCNWAPTVCLAAQTVISFPQTLINWWDSATTSISESWTWAKSRYEAAVTSISEFFSEETNTDTQLEFNDPTDDITDTTISFSDQCPAPITLADFNYHGIQQKWEMDFTGWCDVLTTYFKPIVIAMAGFSAVLIVSGVRENG